VTPRKNDAVVARYHLKNHSCVTVFIGSFDRELNHDITLFSDDISYDRTIKNEIKKLAANERLLLKDRLVETVKYGGVCISPDI
jgi:hypothetical protein